ncbi:MAG: tyrosine-type recombinase/integrase, partial [Gammaproteobacteria bacterium]|nr:tyrosine-type recombinase/integrase [Gammaproteobacteria bacterium]
MPQSLTLSNQPATSELVNAQPAAAYLASLKTKVSRAGQESALNTVAQVLIGTRDWRQVDWSTLTAAHVAAVMSKLNEYAPATRKKTLAAMKGVARAAWRLNLMDSEIHERIRDIQEKRGSRLPAGRYLDVGEVELLLRACAGDKTPAGARDAAMIALARSAGLRREEIAELALALYDKATGTIRLIGKGDKERLAYVKNGAKRYMDKWLTYRGSEAGAL